MVLNGPYAPPRNNPPLRRDYNRTAMMDRPISEGRDVHLHDFPLSPFGLQFERMGWSTFLLVSGFIYPSLVYEFYANFEFVNERTVRFRMFETTHSYTLSQFGMLLDIPCVEDRFPEAFTRDEMWQALCRQAIPYNLMLRTGIRDDYLRAEFIVPNQIIRSNMYHREATNPTLSGTEERLLWCLTNNVSMNIANMVASRMSRLHYEPERPLPYGALLTRLFYRIGVIHGGIPNNPISTLPINRASVYEDSSDDETPSVDPESSFAPTTSSTRSDARSYFRR